MRLLGNFLNESGTIHFKFKESEGHCRVIIYVGEVNIGKVDVDINGDQADITYIHINEVYRKNGYATTLLKKLCIHLITEHKVCCIRMNVRARGKTETSMFRNLLTDIGFNINTYGTNNATFTLNIYQSDE